MLKNYAGYFAAFLLNNARNKENIERIILYGSAARGEAGKESDVDIFIEAKKPIKKFEKEIKEIEEKFYQSREAVLFKTKGIDNKFSIKIGKLKDWKDLYRSIASTGIVLYGPYEAKELPSGVEHFLIIFWEKIVKNRGSFLNKLYGVTIRGRHYPGLLLKYNGKKLGKSCIMMPIQYKEEIFKLLKHHQVKARILDVFS